MNLVPPELAESLEAPWARGLVGIALLLALLAAGNAIAARVAERRNPPRGAFLRVDGTRLHYTDRGEGPAVLLLHGNVVSGDDFDTSGLAERLLPRCRVLVFDRPGFGHSTRPRGRSWTAAEQAEAIHAALGRLGVGPVVVVGHSWGTLVALALAQRHRAETAGLVLVSGYYFPTARLDAALVAPVAMPALGDVLRYTVSPLLGWIGMPLTKRAMFAPAEVPARFQAEYSDAMALRPSQIRATAMDGAAMVRDAQKLAPHHGALAGLPVAILAGEGDKVVSPRLARRLQDAIPGSTLRFVPAGGHMVHHVATDLVARAVLEVVERAEATSRPANDAMPAARRSGAA